MGTKTGLRERKKAAARAAMSQAAMRLAVERGVEQVTIDAIAAAADVSTSTFHNYFSGKEEAILSVLRDQMLGSVDMLRARPADEPVWDMLLHVASAQVSVADDELDELLVRIRLVETSPGLVPHRADLFEEVERTVAEIVAQRTGTSVDDDLYPRLICVAASAAMAAALKAWAAGRRGTNPVPLIAEAFALLRAGLPEPPR